MLCVVGFENDGGNVRVDEECVALRRFLEEGPFPGMADADTDEIDSRFPMAAVGRVDFDEANGENLAGAPNGVNKNPCISTLGSSLSSAPD